MSELTSNETLKEKLTLETDTINWRELQRFFAKGVVFYLDADEDLVDVAVNLAEDKQQAVQALKDTNKLAAVTNQQARDWYEQETELLCVVVAPFLLVQDK